MAEIARKPALDVVSMGDEHADAVAEFFRAVGWGTGATAEDVRRARKLASAGPFFPGKDVPTILFLSDQQVLGYVSSIPVLVWSDGQERRAEWIKGLMVRPEHRNGPIGFLLVKELLRRLECPLSLTVSSASRRLFEALGMVNLGLVPNYLRVLDARTVLNKLDLEALGVSVPRWIVRAVKLSQNAGLASILGICADGVLNLRVALTSIGGHSLRVSSDCAFPERAALDQLWHLVRGKILIAPVRNGSYLSYRYGSSAEYRPVTVHDREDLVGFAVVRRPRGEGDPRLKGIRVASLSDLLFPLDRMDIAAATLGGAEVVARSLGADALLCSPSHLALTSVLPRHGYMRVPANMHFLIPSPSKCKLPRTLDQWWLTRGDMNADEVF